MNYLKEEKEKNRVALWSQCQRPMSFLSVSDLAILARHQKQIIDEEIEAQTRCKVGLIWSKFRRGDTVTLNYNLGISEFSERHPDGPLYHKENKECVPVLFFYKV